MSAPLWVTETAEAFWAAAGADEPFPRTLRRAVAQALPLTIVLIPRLGINAATNWLRRHDVGCTIQIPDRPLRACLIARSGSGIIFLDGADDEDEQRFSLAHEIAHFLRDYSLPRYKAVQRIGPGIVDVLDGLRPAAVGERAQGLIEGVAVEPSVHLMDRSGDGHVTRTITASEESADRLAYELLAPCSCVMIDVLNRNFCEPHLVADLLVEQYGLPRTPAARYAVLLVGRKSADDAFLRYLRDRL